MSGALSEAWFWRAVLTGCLVSVPCALIGVFLYLRRMSLVADALAHVALPGIVLAFLVSGGVELPALLVGAVLVGVGSTLAMQGLATRGVREDASIGVVFTTLFALGVVLLSTSARGVDLDLDCVLFGDILGVSDTSIAALALTGLTVTALVVAFYRWLALGSFDPVVAATLGVPVAMVHNGLVTAAAVTAVVSFEAVGAVLGIAMVIVPAATAHRLADRLVPMLVIAVAHGVVSTLLGVVLSVLLDCSTAGAIVVVSGAMFLTVVIAGSRADAHASPRELGAHA